MKRKFPLWENEKIWPFSWGYYSIFDKLYELTFNTNNFNFTKMIYYQMFENKIFFLCFVWTFMFKHYQNSVMPRLSQSSFWKCRIPSGSWSFTVICIPDHRCRGESLLIRAAQFAHLGCGNGAPENFRSLVRGII